MSIQVVVTFVICSQIEVKMMESAQNLLEISQDEAKVLKLQEAVRAHQSNLDRIQEQLEQEKSEN